MSIARIWSGRAATAEDAAGYQRYFREEVTPHLQEIPGFLGARLMRRDFDERIEFTVMTLWESMEAVRAFAGSSPEVAVVAPAARALLGDFDRFVSHHETVFEAAGRSGL